MDLSLAPALRVSSSGSIAFIGSGGKTTAIFKLARELSSPVIVTATTHLGIWQTKLSDKHIITESSASIESLEHGLNGVVLVTGEVDGDRTKPINDELLSWLNQFCGYHAIPLLIEADGSRQKPLKAWAEHEPPIPSFVDVVVQVVGMNGLGKPLTEEYVHRSEIFSELSDLQMGENITPESVAKVLLHPKNGIRNARATARKVLLLNQADDVEMQSIARSMALSLQSRYSSVVITNLFDEQIYAVHEPIAGIVLAAGGSKRFGMPKQLLEWKGQSFVRAVVKTAIEAGLSPVIVVTGSNAEQIESTIRDLDVKMVMNEDWESGQGSSIREGIRGLTYASTTVAGFDMPTATQPTRPPLSANNGAEGVGGAIFLLADQPQVNTSIIHALKEKHAEGLHPIVAPMILDRRGNPVLFDRVTFLDLMSIEGDTGGRAIFHKHRVEYLPWHDDSLLMDVDTPEQYQKLIENKDI